MVKTLQKSSQKQNGRWPWNLVCSIWDLGPIKVCSNDDPWLTLTYFTSRPSSVTQTFVLKKGPTVNISDSIVAGDIKVDICKQRNELLQILRSRSFTDLYPGCLKWRLLTSSPLKLLGWLKPNYKPKKTTNKWSLYGIGERRFVH